LSVKSIAMIGLVLICFLGGGCTPAGGFDSSLKSIVEPYRFSILEWEFKVLPAEVSKALFGKQEKVDEEVQVVTEYFLLIERIKTLNTKIEAINRGDGQGDLAPLKAELTTLQEQKKALEDIVAGVMVRQVKATLAQQGIFNPFDKYIGLKVGFPPPNFRLEKPPHLLVISPRDRIESMREIILQQSIGLEEIEEIEAEADKLGVSSLVAELGGFAGVYPSFVTDEAGLRFVFDTVTDEWLHKYLVFKPLGFRYLLDVTGVSRDYEIATMNETVTSMVSKEIGSIVEETYYPEYEAGGREGQAADSEFNREMREIRRAVDEYLAQGEIEQAEEFMEERRQYLTSKGYYIRKLNQAYFAFHGAYADSPTSISPIGLELKQLRSQSTSLKDFLETAAALTSRQDLQQSLE